MVVIVRFIIKEREETFTGAQRSHIVWQILLRTPYDQARPDKVGIVRLMNKNVYEACFPLHEGRHDRDGPQGEKSDRRVRLGSVLTPDQLISNSRSCSTSSGLNGPISTRGNLFG